MLLEKCKHDSAREQLVQVSMHYIRFLTEHPAFRRIVMQSFQDCDEEYRVLRGQMSRYVKQNIRYLWCMACSSGILNT